MLRDSTKPIGVSTYSFSTELVQKILAAKRPSPNPLLNQEGEQNSPLLDKEGPGVVDIPALEAEIDRLLYPSIPFTIISTASSGESPWAMRVSICCLSTLPMAASWVTLAWE